MIPAALELLGDVILGDDVLAGDVRLGVTDRSNSLIIHDCGLKGWLSLNKTTNFTHKTKR